MGAVENQRGIKDLLGLGMEVNRRKKNDGPNGGIIIQSIQSPLSSIV
jgi:hypothetical protein